MIWGDALLHWVHLLAAITWLGGMLFTALVLRPILSQTLDSQGRVSFFRALGARLRFVEIGCLTTLVLTGVAKLWRMGSWERVVTGDFGRILGAKLLLVACMVVLAGLHTSWGRKLGQAAPGSPDFGALARRVSWGARLEVAAGLAVVFCAALLRMNPF